MGISLSIHELQGLTEDMAGSKADFPIPLQETLRF
jgi:hypothetical protein